MPNAPVVHQRDGHSWRELGEGDETLGGGEEVIVFLHPIVGTSVYWTPVMVELATNRRCVAWDAPGYCGTAPVDLAPGGPSLAELVTARLLNFCDVAGIERAHVVGLSLGAMYALHAAGQPHGRFERLVLADTSAAFGIDPNAWLDDWLGDLRAGTPLTEVVSNSIDAITHATPDAGLQKQIVDSFAHVSNEAFETASKYIAFHNVRESLASIPNPTLVMVGEHDGETPPEYAEEIAALMPDASYELLPGLGHLTSLEAPSVFASKVRSFLDSRR